MIQRLIAGYLILFLVGVFDWSTGPEARFGSLYLFLLVFVGLTVGGRSLILFALVTAVVWIGSELLMKLDYSRPWFFYWNIVNKTGSIAIAVFIVEKVRLTLKSQWDLICELRHTSLRLSQIGEALPVCRLCREINVDDDSRARLEEVIRDDTDGIVFGEVCHNCLEDRAQRLKNIRLDAYFPAAHTRGA